MTFSLSQILDFVLPRHAKRSDYTHRQYLDSLLFNILVTLALCLALGLLTKAAESTLLTALFSFAAVGFLLMLALLRTSLSLTYVNTGGVLVVSSVVGSLASVTGGLGSPAISWMIMLPLVTVVLMRGKMGLALLVLQGVPLVGFIYCELAGVELPELLASKHYVYAQIFSIASAWLVGVLSIASHKYWQSQLQSSLSHSADVDALTGLMSRGNFEVQTKRELAYAGRDCRPLSFLMIDMDRLKQINDEHGHAEGDQMIALVANIIIRELRSVDFCGRIGGDEFCAVMPGANSAVARLVAERLEQAVSGVAPRRKRDKATPVSISVGASTYEGYGPPNTIEHYISLADQQMYQKKAIRRAVG
jgi:diguanylate cyclase (GGDEF)-like protein